MSTSHLSPNRIGKIGSSHIAALFGRSNWLTRLQLYAHFVDGYDLEKQEDDRMRIGRLLQDDILQLTIEKTGWELEANPDDSWIDHPDPQYRAGCTLDAWVRRHEWGLGIAEIKNVDFLRWRDEGWSDEAAPVRVELQLQEQMWVTGAAWGVIPVLIGGNDLRIIPSNNGIVGRRLPLPEVHRSIESALTDFWHRVEHKDPPPVVGHELEIPALAHLYPEPVLDPTLDLIEDAAFAQLVADYQWAKEKGKQLAALEKEAKIKLLGAMGGSALARTRGAWVKVGRNRIAGRTQEVKPHTRTELTIKPVAGEEQVEMEGIE